MRLFSWRPTAPACNPMALVGLLAAVLLCIAGCPSPPEPLIANHPFPQHATYTQGALSITNRTQTQLDNDVRAAYDRWKDNYLAQARDGAGGESRYRILLSKSPTAPTVSEGQGYGMLIVALMAGHDPNAKELFDGLWRFVVDHRSETDPRLPDWFVNGNERPDTNGEDSAFDGDADIAYGLLLADAQWGSGGDFDYLAEAKTIIEAIMESEVGADSRLPLLGDWVDPAGEEINQFVTRCSDFLLGHFRAYGRAAGDPSWNDVAGACQAVTEIIQRDHSPESGLLPDFVVPTSAEDTTPTPAPPDLLEGPADGMYSYNAGRVPWRIGTDWLMNGNEMSRAEVRRMSQWIESSTGGDPLEIKPGYMLDGTPIPPAEFFTTFFAAPFGVAAMCVPHQQAWLNSVYAAVFDKEEEYYEDSVTLLSMLVMTHNFWDPTQ